MTKEDIFRELGGIDAEIVTKNAPEEKAAVIRYIWLRRIAAMACVCLLCLGIARIAVGFFPNQATDSYRVGNCAAINDFSELPARYDGKLLLENLDLKNSELFYDENGSAEDPEDWYSFLTSDWAEDHKMTLFCLFDDEKTLEDWKVDMVFTKDATRTVNVNGTNVQIARNEHSLLHEYWYYAIFEYDGVIYDLRVQSDDPDMIYQYLHRLLG